jgi:hypothetical protein
MGVTAFFYAYDPRVSPVPPTVEGLRASGALDDELTVIGEAARWLREIPSPLGDNKRWSDNLAGDWAWRCARAHVAAEARGPIDRWLSHLFWEGEGCPCGREPLVVGDSQVVYDRALLEHIVSLACPLVALGPALSVEFDGDPPKSPRLDRPWIYDVGELEGLVHEWQRIFTEALAAGPGWQLLRWVWY